MRREKGELEGLGSVDPDHESGLAVRHERGGDDDVMPRLQLEPPVDLPIVDERPV